MLLKSRLEASKEYFQVESHRSNILQPRNVKFSFQFRLTPPEPVTPVKKK